MRSGEYSCMKPTFPLDHNWTTAPIIASEAETLMSTFVLFCLSSWCLLASYIRRVINKSSFGLWHTLTGHFIIYTCWTPCYQNYLTSQWTGSNPNEFRHVDMVKMTNWRGRKSETEHQNGEERLLMILYKPIYRESFKKVKTSNEWQFYGLKSNCLYHKQPSNHSVNVTVFYLALNRW